MNVHFPGFNSVSAFFVTLGLMGLVIVGMLGFFRWKRWL
jgi:Mg2+ and Co2+ transporter CorA